jgi:hypothetical protein
MRNHLTPNHPKKQGIQQTAILDQLIPVLILKLLARLNSIAQLIKISKTNPRIAKGLIISI